MSEDTVLRWYERGLVPNLEPVTDADSASAVWMFHRAAVAEGECE